MTDETGCDHGGPLMPIRSSWALFEKNVLPKNAPPIQRTEMRKAYYGGAMAVLNALERIGEPDIGEQQGVEFLSMLKNEIIEFVLSQTRHRRN